MTLQERAEGQQLLFKQECDRIPERKHYNYTIFASIGADDEISTSQSSDILSNAAKCFLLHYWVELRDSRWYHWLRLEYINEQGEVNGGVLDNGFTIQISNAWELNLNPTITLDRYGERVFGIYNYERNDLNLEERLKITWKAYCACRQYETIAQAKLMGEIISRDLEIASLKRKLESKEFLAHFHAEECNMYEAMLASIQKMISTVNV